MHENATKHGSMRLIHHSVVSFWPTIVGTEIVSNLSIQCGEEHIETKHNEHHKEIWRIDVINSSIRCFLLANQCWDGNQE